MTWPILNQGPGHKELPLPIPAIHPYLQSKFALFLLSHRCVDSHQAAIWVAPLYIVILAHNKGQQVRGHNGSALISHHLQFCLFLMWLITLDRLKQRYSWKLGTACWIFFWKKLFSHLISLIDTDWWNSVPQKTGTSPGSIKNIRADSRFAPSQ